MKKEMDRWGVGPVFAASSIVYGVMTLILTRIYTPFFQIPVLPYSLLKTIGIILLIIGIPFFIIAWRSGLKAFKADKLITTGTFRLCRHPLYASWIFFIVPGSNLISNSWISLTTPIFMYIVARNLVKKEENYLEETFGSDYTDYKSKTPCLLPIGFLK